MGLWYCKLHEIDRKRYVKMMGGKWSELFPTRWSVLVFVLYIVLFVNQGILVTASQNDDNKYTYDIVTVVLLTEFLKLTASVALYCKKHPVTLLLREGFKNRGVLILYFIPAFLYCFYNNLSFVNLAAFDPTTYYLLLQFRVVITAVIFQVTFKKNLSPKQWLSLLILTAGCMLKQVNFSGLIERKGETTTAVRTKKTGFSMDLNAALILVQAACSCLAGVYNEYLLKRPGADVDIYVQNVFMYLDSIVCNGALLLLQGNLLVAFSLDNLKKICHYRILLVMLNNTAIGIITSFFLKSMNSILKTFASAMELIFTALLCRLLFGIPVYLNTVLSICIVLYATFLYSQNPVSNQPMIGRPNRNPEEQEELLMEEV